jgi:hypothetical protein
VHIPQVFHNPTGLMVAVGEKLTEKGYELGMHAMVMKLPMQIRRQLYKCIWPVDAGN